MTKPTVAFICGSIREASFHRRIGKAIADMVSDRLEIEEVAIADLPLYNPDIDNDDRPEAWQTYRDAIEGKDAVLFASPEWNRSITGALKNAIDVGSRPYGKGVLIGKPCAVFSTTPGSTGALGGSLAILPCFKTLDMPDMGQPEAYYGGISDDKIDLDGTIHDNGLRKEVSRFAKAFASHIEQMVRGGSEHAG
ncbi:NADPH-dependent FMN reductase [Sphingomicrobium clamense]|uniref:NAD(P)H-dependent oxidoreductase n=1 Tax=Sphingomicrobium clamense TaxID=2851013 RepID=A0ABS6V7L4_9SPHN|nr:NADPH-dependent FMN reductase [Sphingomicrobium sp. B8]MBW0145566.1 NAD(P)H-dependent oxidoreductase [Sphingomicrobium sp. B8]